MKTVATTSPALVLLNDEGAHILDCDPSDLGIGAILSQRNDVEEWLIVYDSRLVSVRSRTTVLPEKNSWPWSTSRYCTASICLVAAKDGSGSPAAIAADPEAISQQDRWLECLAKFDFEIVHRPGRRYGNADALSQRPFRQCGMEDLNPVAAVTKERVETPLILNTCSQDRITE